MQNKDSIKKKYKALMENSVSSLQADVAFHKHKKDIKDQQTAIENHENHYMHLVPNSGKMSSKETLKKKKKKRKKCEDGPLDQTLVMASSKKKEQDLGQNHGKKKKKHTKRVKQLNLDKDANVTNIFISDQALLAASDEIATKKKKKNDSENNCTESCLILEKNILESVSSLQADVAFHKHKKDIKDRQTDTENHGIYMHLVPNSGKMPSKETLKKKKKKRKKCEDGPLDQTLVMASSKKKEQDHGQNHGKKKKKHTKLEKQLNLDKDVFISDQALLAASDEIVTKKKKKNHAENNCTESCLILEKNILESVTSHIENVSKRVRRKKRKKNYDRNNEWVKDVNEENIQMKNIKRKQNSSDSVSASDGTLLEQDSDMNKVLKKKGRIENTEGQESNSLDPKCHTLKMYEKNTADIDKSERKEKTYELNQWVTASLGTEEKDKKFLRLLGGFRKSYSTSFKSGAKGGNLAMNKEQESLYRKELENVYERAISTSLQRGVGLGYEPPPDAGKTFFIDKDKTKSKKFDD